MNKNNKEKVKKKLYIILIEKISNFTKILFYKCLYVCSYFIFIYTFSFFQGNVQIFVNLQRNSWNHFYI